MAQQTTPDPMTKLKADMQSAQRKMNDLQAGVRLTNIRDEMEDYEEKSTMLRSKISAIRTKGYVFGKDFIHEHRIFEANGWHYRPRFWNR